MRELADEDVPAPLPPGELLRLVSGDLAELEIRRSALMRERDAAVLVIRRAGAPWDDVAAAAGVSRVALVRRLSREGLLDRARPVNHQGSGGLMASWRDVEAEHQVVDEA